MSRTQDDVTAFMERQHQRTALARFHKTNPPRQHPNGGDSPLPVGKQWTPHDGIGARARRRRQLAKQRAAEERRAQPVDQEPTA